MARNRTISPDFWTWEAVIDCKPMTRLLFIGLWNFADDGGVQPLRPRTIRMQVFPGDAIGNDAVRAMIDELAAQGLVLTYAVDGIEYVAIADWDQLQRVGKRARRRFPAIARGVPGTGEAGDAPSRTMANHSNGETPPCIGEAGDEPSQAIANHSNGETPPCSREAVDEPSRTIANHSHGETRCGPSAAPDVRGEDGCERERDVLAAVGAVDNTPPAGPHELAVAVDVNRMAA